MEAERVIVARIYEETLAGSSQMAIARRLNRDGIRSATGKKWTQARVRNVLANPLYMGKVRGVYDGAHDAIVSEETWRSAAAMRDVTEKRKAPNAKGNMRGSAPGSNNGGGRQPNGRHLMTKGLLRCGTCGEAMVPRTERRKNGTRELYLCLGRHRDIESCGQGPVDRTAIDEAIVGELSTRFLDVETTRERLRAKREADAALAAEALGQAEAEALRAGERLQRVQRAFQDGYLEPADYAEQRADLLTERDAAEAQAERLRSRKVEVDDDYEVETYRRLAALRDLALGRLDNAPDLEALRKLLRQVFKGVIYFPAEHRFNHAGAAHLCPIASKVVEEQVPACTVPDPTCGHLTRIDDCADCRAYEQALSAEPYDPAEPDPELIIRKVAFPFDDQTSERVTLVYP